MTHLYFFRHGRAVPHGSPDYEESQRPLTAQGERRTRQVARGLRPMLKGLDRILTSPLPRALRTAEIVADVLGRRDRVETCEQLLPEVDPAAILAYLEALQEPRLMIVGHNPNLSGLLNLMLAGENPRPMADLRKAGAACLVRTPGGSFGLDWFVRPGSPGAWPDRGGSEFPLLGDQLADRVVSGERVGRRVERLGDRELTGHVLEFDLRADARFARPGAGNADVSPVGAELAGLDVCP